MGFGGDDVDEDGRGDFVGGVVVDDEAVAYAASAVVAAPDDGAGGEDLLECFDDEVSDRAFVVRWREGGEAIAWEFDDEEGDGIFPGGNYMAPP